MITVYLSGRNDTEWQAPIRELVQEAGTVMVLDPSECALTNVAAHTRWCLMALGQSDIVFVYLENLQLIPHQSLTEIGIARTLGKMIILVDEIGAWNPPSALELSFARECADVVLETIEEGHDTLLTFLGMMIPQEL